MRLTVLAAVAASFALSCTETPEEVGTEPAAATICLGDTLAAAPLPALVQYGPNTVLPTSTVRQTWLLLPWAFHYDNNQNVVVDSWGLFQVDTDVKKVLWGAIVPPSQLGNASVQWSLRAGNHGSFARPPTPPGWPAGTNWAQANANHLVTISARLELLR